MKTCLGARSNLSFLKNQVPFAKRAHMKNPLRTTRKICPNRVMHSLLVVGLSYSALITAHDAYAAGAPGPSHQAGNKQQVGGKQITTQITAKKPARFNVASADIINEYVVSADAISPDKTDKDVESQKGVDKEAGTGKAAENKPQTGPISTPDQISLNQQEALNIEEDKDTGAAGLARNAYFGELHLHTEYSFDAFIFNVRATPDDAYRYAKGETLKHPAGFDIRLGGPPLDFIAVTDHAEYLGMVADTQNPESPLSQHPSAKDFGSGNLLKVYGSFRKVALSLRDGEKLDEFDYPQTEKRAWNEIIAAAERHNDPGAFTTFIGYEFTSAPGGRNLHRNVIFAGAEAPEIPFSAFDSQNPEELWQWLDDMRAQGIEGMAIPHNSNGSNGTMFELETWDDKPIDLLYAQLRARNEPIVEITQVKGTSETHPSLSPNDEWAGFEISERYIGTDQKIKKFKGGYVREALKNGLLIEGEIGANPYEFGVIGASDTHNAGGSYDEDNYFSKVGIVDGTADRRGSIPPDGKKNWSGFAPWQSLADMTGLTLPNRPDRYSYWGASGLAGVWAQENTRASIYGAMRRRETFATSGPRMRVRFFAGFDWPQKLDEGEDLIETLYQIGAPMGAKITMDGKGAGQGPSAPEFYVWSTADPRSAPLQRMQIIKGWVENGEALEKVYDVSCSDGLMPDPKTHRCPDNGAVVDISNCTYSQDKGAGELATRWRDPDFNPDAAAFYYLRVLENPTCRWSTWDAIRNGTPPNPKLPETLQERAWSSPIWYHPSKI